MARHKSRHYGTRGSRPNFLPTRPLGITAPSGDRPAPPDRRDNPARVPRWSHRAAWAIYLGENDPYHIYRGES